MDIIKKLKQGCSIVGIIAILCIATNGHAFYLKLGSMHDVMRYKIISKGSDAIYNFGGYYNTNPTVDSTSLGIGEEFGGDMVVDINFNSARKIHSDFITINNYKVSIQKNTVALNIYKEIARYGMFNIQAVGGVEYGRFKPTLYGVSPYFAQNLDVQTTVIGSIGARGLLALTEYISIEASGKIGTSCTRKSRQLTLINGGQDLVGLHPIVSYGVYAGVIFNL